MAFFMNHRRYWGRLKSLDNGQWQVSLVGIAKRHPYQFDDEFKRYAQMGADFMKQFSTPGAINA